MPRVACAQGSHAKGSTPTIAHAEVHMGAHGSSPRCTRPKGCARSELHAPTTVRALECAPCALQNCTSYRVGCNTVENPQYDTSKGLRE